MFKKLLASAGIGNAEVDTIVLTEEIYPGSTVDLQIEIRGGEVEQDLNGLTIALCTSVKEEVETDDIEFDMNTTRVIDRWQVPLETSVIPAGETIVVDCQIQIHPETPMTEVESRSHVWLKTGLDIDSGLDASDKDYLLVRFPDLQRMVLSAFDEMGYDLVKVDTERGNLSGNGFESSIGCYQEFEFRKRTGVFSTQEVEVSFVQYDDSVGVLLEIDRSYGGDVYVSDLIPIDADYDSVSNWIHGNVS